MEALERFTNVLGLPTRVLRPGLRQPPDAVAVHAEPHGRCETTRRVHLEFQLGRLTETDEEVLDLREIEVVQGVHGVPAIPHIEALVQHHRGDQLQQPPIRLLALCEGGVGREKRRLPHPGVQGAFEDIRDQVRVLLLGEMPQHGESARVAVAGRRLPEEASGSEAHLVVQRPVGVVHTPSGVRLCRLVVVQSLPDDVDVVALQPGAELTEAGIPVVDHATSFIIISSAWQSRPAGVRPGRRSRRAVRRTSAGPRCGR
ncbi:hypothetical protein [Streptomyces bobili]|uniref:hypothetical protein n=1 Tax=Streptomyces bobili TaxID=67280 RepID=UPI0037F58B0B